jgi:ATP-dependent DNA ligase
MSGSIGSGSRRRILPTSPIIQWLSFQARPFDLLMINGDDLRRKPYVERSLALRKLLRHGRGIQYVEHAEGHGDKLFAAACNLGLEFVSKKLDAPYRSGLSKTWIKVKNQNAPAAICVIEGTSDLLPMASLSGHEILK